jgi:hypothetical protein
MGRSLMIRDRELVSSDIFMGRVVFSDNLKTMECLSKNGIRSRPLLGGVCFGIFIGVPRIYGAFVYVTSLLRVSVVLCEYLFINNNICR